MATHDQPLNYITFNSLRVNVTNNGDEVAIMENGLDERLDNIMFDTSGLAIEHDSVGTAEVRPAKAIDEGAVLYVLSGIPKLYQEK